MTIIKKMLAIKLISTDDNDKIKNINDSGVGRYAIVIR